MSKTLKINKHGDIPKKLGESQTNQYMNTNYNQSLENYKKVFDISNLNFKTLQNSNLKNRTNTEIIPNDNHDESSSNIHGGKMLKKTLFKTNSQKNLEISGMEKNGNVNDISESNIELNMDFGSNSSNNSFVFKNNAKSQKEKVPMTNKHGEYESISDIHTLKLIIQNFENALREKNDEIKILKKNFKEKINLMEQENKILIENLDSKHKLEIGSINQNSKNRLIEIIEENKINKTRYENTIKSILKEYTSIKQTSIPLTTHNMKLNEMNYKWKENFEYIKNLFKIRLKEISNHFNNTDYNILLERIQFFNSHKEVLSQYQNLDPEINFSTDEFVVFIDKLKLKILEVDYNFFKEVSEIQVNYEIIYNSIKEKNKDKYEQLKTFVHKKFDDIEKHKSFLDDNLRVEEELLGDYKILNNQSGSTSLINDKSNFTLRDSINRNNKEEIQFNSSLLKNATITENLGELNSKSELSEIQLAKGIILIVFIFRQFQHFQKSKY